MRQTIYPEAVIPERASLLGDFYGIADEDFLENNALYRHTGRVYDYDVHGVKTVVHIAHHRDRLRKINEEFRQEGRQLGSVVLEVALRVKPIH